MTRDSFEIRAQSGEWAMTQLYTNLSQQRHPFLSYSEHQTDGRRALFRDDRPLLRQPEQVQANETAAPPLLSLGIHEASQQGHEGASFNQQVNLGLSSAASSLDTGSHPRMNVGRQEPSGAVTLWCACYEHKTEVGPVQDDRLSRDV